MLRQLTKFCFPFIEHFVLLSVHWEFWKLEQSCDEVIEKWKYKYFERSYNCYRSLFDEILGKEKFFVFIRKWIYSLVHFILVVKLLKLAWTETFLLFLYVATVLVSDLSGRKLRGEHDWWYNSLLPFITTERNLQQQGTNKDCPTCSKRRCTGFQPNLPGTGWC